MTIIVGLRMKRHEHRRMRLAAERLGLDVVSYVRMLIATHPKWAREKRA